MKKTRNRFEKAFQTKNPTLEYETLKLRYTLERTYNPDFIDHQSKTIYETKGLWVAEDRQKILAVRNQHPDWRIVMVFQNPDRKIAKGSKTSYSVWCGKHGIEWRTL